MIFGASFFGLKPFYNILYIPPAKAGGKFKAGDNSKLEAIQSWRQFHFLHQWSLPSSTGLEYAKLITTGFSQWFLDRNT